MIVVVAALKGGVGKTTTSVYLAALAGSRRDVTLVDADPQASAAEWLESSEDDAFARVEVVEAPTDRLLMKALDRVDEDSVAVVDTPPGQERLLAKALSVADVAIVPTRVGGVETTRAEAVLDLMPDDLPAGLVIASARSFTSAYHEAMATWHDERVPVWATVPERVAIAAGPAAPLSQDGLDSYRDAWRRALRATRA